MKLSRVLFLAFSSVALFAAFKFFYPSGPWRHPYVPPKENPDGTIDYTLIAKPLERLDGDYWVLRFPKDWKVSTSENAEPAEVKSPNGYDFRFNVLPNDWVRVELDYLTLRALPKDFPLQPDRFAITAYASKHETRPGTLPNLVEGCTSLGEVAKNVIAFKSTSETASMCSIDRQGIAFLVRDANGRDLSFTDCTDDWLNNSYSNNEVTACLGTVLLAGERKAHMTINLIGKKIGPVEIMALTQNTRQFLEVTTVNRGTIRAYGIYKN